MKKCFVAGLIVMVTFGLWAETVTNNLDVQGGFIYNHGAINPGDIGLTFTNDGIRNVTVSAGQLSGVDPETGGVITNCANLLPLKAQSLTAVSNLVVGAYQRRSLVILQTNIATAGWYRIARVSARGVGTFNLAVSGSNADQKMVVDVTTGAYGTGNALFVRQNSRYNVGPVRKIRISSESATGNANLDVYLSDVQTDFYITLDQIARVGDTWRPQWDLYSAPQMDPTVGNTDVVELNTTKYFSLQLANSESLPSILAQNAVGIGTNAPTEMLHVIGNVKISGQFIGSGSGLTNLNAAFISSGSISVSSLPTSGTWNASGMTISNVDIMGNGSGLTNLSLNEGSIAETKLSDGVIDKLNQILNAKSYGAIGDGISDDTTKLQDAINAAAGKTLLIPCGTYLVSGLNLTNANTSILLDSGTVIVLVSGSNKNVFTVTSDNCSIRGGWVEGNSAAQSYGHGVSVEADHFTLEDTTISDTKEYGLFSQGSYNVVQHSTFLNTKYAGIMISSKTNAMYTGNVIHGNLVDRSALGTNLVSAGLYIHGMSGPNIRGSVTDNHVIMPITANYGAICIEIFGQSDYCTISGNCTYGGMMGISVGSDFSAIVGNQIYSPWVYGIELTGKYQSCTANTIAGNSLTRRGIIHATTATTNQYNITISGNVINDIAENAIDVSAGGSFFTISGNAVKHCNWYAIILGTGCSDITVSGNSLNGEGKKGIILCSCNRIVVQGNLIDGFTENSVLVYVPSAVTSDNILVAQNAFFNNGCGNDVWFQLENGGLIGNNVIIKDNLGLTKNYFDRKNKRFVSSGIGTPEGYVVAGIGSQYYRTDGGSNSTLYIKESNDGESTGWVAK